MTIEWAALYRRTSLSPVLSRDAFSLNFRVLTVENQSGEETLALFASARLPARYTSIYGGRIRSAICVVAIDAATGRITHGNAGPGDMVPLESVMEPAPELPTNGCARLAAAEVYFAVDLRRHLLLPPTAGTYNVFLWLDDVISAVGEVALPGAAAGPQRPPAPDPHHDFRFRTTPKTPAANTPVFMKRESGRVYGVVTAAARVPRGPDCLSLLALDFRSRAVKSHSFPLPGAGSAGFDFDIFDLFGRPRAGWLDPALPHQKLLLLACARGAVSEVLAADPVS